MSLVASFNIFNIEFWYFDFEQFKFKIVQLIDINKTKD